MIQVFKQTVAATYMYMCMPKSLPMSNPADELVRNKNVLVTGASSGIGEATALEFCRLGANVVATARRKERLQQVNILTKLYVQSAKMFDIGQWVV